MYKYIMYMYMYMYVMRKLHVHVCVKLMKHSHHILHVGCTEDITTTPNHA